MNFWASFCQGHVSFENNAVAGWVISHFVKLLKWAFPFHLCVYIEQNFCGIF